MSWISVKKDMPREHDSIFKDMYGTSEWREYMYRKISERVFVTILFSDGTKTVTDSCTHDGEWKIGTIAWADKGARVTHWMMMPQPAEEEEE